MGTGVNGRTTTIWASAAISRLPPQALPSLRARRGSHRAEPRLLGRRGGGVRRARARELGVGGADVGYLGGPGVQGSPPSSAARGKDAVELGCGTGYVSAWLAR